MNFHRDTFDLYTIYICIGFRYSNRAREITRPLPSLYFHSSYYIFATRMASSFSTPFAISPPRFFLFLFSTFVPKFHPAIVPPPRPREYTAFSRGLIPLNRDLVRLERDWFSLNKFQWILGEERRREDLSMELLLTRDSIRKTRRWIIIFVYRICVSEIVKNI